MLPLSPLQQIGPPPSFRPLRPLPCPIPSVPPKVMTLLLFSRVWSRALDLILPLGFLLLLLSTVPQFVSYLNLTKLLDDGPSSNVTLAAILIPNAASWFAMWLSR